jgi:Ca-activated chloride channel family protein
MTPRLAVRLALLAAVAGCASPAATSAGLGVNVGGAQDIKLVRQLIDDGRVPSSDQFTVQGLYAEHDLPVGEAPAGKTLHLALGLGIAPALPSGDRTHWVQVGLGSGLDAATFQRPPQHIVVVADRSGSMTGEKIAALRQALGELVGQLNPADSLGIVEFDDAVDTVAPLAPVTDKAALTRAIGGIEARGSTDIEAGLRAGYDMFLRTAAPPGYQRRVILLTDALPNTGTTDPEGFESLVARFGKAGVGMTVFGIGADFGAELAEVIGNQRGGNYVYLRDADDVKKVFHEDFNFLMSPAAYDVALTVKPAPGFAIAEAYGVSDFKPVDGAYSLKVKSLFFSKNRGAIMLRLRETGEAKAEGPIMTGSLSYLRADAKTAETDTVEATATGDRPTGEANYFAPTAVRKAVALTNEFLALQDALTRYREGHTAEAQATLALAKAQLESAKAALAATDLDTEIALVTKLSANMGHGASPDLSPSLTSSFWPSPSPSASGSPTPEPSAPADGGQGVPST